MRGLVHLIPLRMHLTASLMEGDGQGNGVFPMRDGEHAVGAADTSECSLPLQYCSTSVIFLCLRLFFLLAP